MLDSFLNTVRQGAERVQRRGEEVAQVARLRMEVFQLTRELDSHYARLGRSYHAGADVDLLQEIQADVRRVEADIQARERLMTELNEVGAADGVPSDEAGAVVRKSEIHQEGAGIAATPHSDRQVVPETVRTAVGNTAAVNTESVGLNSPAFTDAGEQGGEQHRG